LTNKKFSIKRVSALFSRATVLLNLKSCFHHASSSSRNKFLSLKYRGHCFIIESQIRIFLANGGNYNPRHSSVSLDLLGAAFFGFQQIFRENIRARKRSLLHSTIRILSNSLTNLIPLTVPFTLSIRHRLLVSLLNDFSPLSFFQFI
jgi:hypothetical protein